MNHQLEAICFDLFGTLVYISKPTNPYLKMSQDIGLSDIENDNLKHQALTQNFSSLQELIKTINPNLRVDLSPYESMVKDEVDSIVCFPQTRQILQTIKDKNLKIGLISNLATPYKKAVDNLQLNNFFDTITFSCDCGLRKPNPKIFEQTAQKLNISPNKIIMVGDKLKNDVQGAKNANFSDGLLIDKFNFSSQ